MTSAPVCRRPAFSADQVSGSSSSSSGSLYAMALGAPRWLGAVTPLGGLCFLAGWALLAWAARAVGADANR